MLFIEERERCISHHWALVWDRAKPVDWLDAPKKVLLYRCLLWLRSRQRLLSGPGKLQINGLGHYFPFYCEIHLFVNKFYLNAKRSPSFLFRNEKDGN